MDNTRYDRQIALPEIGAVGQEKLRQARVLIVGVGGLGSPIALYLAGAGVGTLGLIDADTVSISNLQRQVLYTEQQVNLPKVYCAAERLKALNHEVLVQPHHARLTTDNATALLCQYDYIVDACDNFATRYLLSDTCMQLGKPYIYGAIQGLQGQVAILCTGTSPKSYRTLYPDEDALTQSASALSRAVLGTTPAIVGSVQAHETIKLICGYGEPLVNRLWSIDLDTMQSFLITI